MQVVLSIGGFDPTSGAGVIRDILTFRKLGVYGFAVATTITFQDLNGFYGYRALKPEEVARQIDALTKDFKIKYVKISMVGSREIAELLAKKIDEKNWYVIFDPLLAAKNGREINKKEEIEELLKRSKIITPNVPEAEALSGMKIEDEGDVKRAGKILREKYGAQVIIKGGHLKGVDYLIGDGIISVGMQHTERVVHGTGCAYSSALLAYLAQGMNIKDAFIKTRIFIQGEIEKSVNLGGKYLVMS